MFQVITVLGAHGCALITGYADVHVRAVMEDEM
jgi:hypothetical protein